MDKFKTIYSGVIYSFKNKLNNKRYIGQSTVPKHRYIQHIINSRNGSKTHFHRAICKYGINNFEYTILEEIVRPSYEEYKKDINKLELYYIVMFDSFNNGYNRSDKNNCPTWAEYNIKCKRGVKLSEEHKLKLRLAAKLKKFNFKDRNLSNNSRSKEVVEIDNFNNILNTYGCAKEISLRYNINYSTLRYKLKNNTLIINNNFFIWKDKYNENNG